MIADHQSPGRDNFGSLLLACSALLITSLFGAASLTGPLAWAVGLVYICYDTWLLSQMVRTSRRALRDQPFPQTPPPRPTVAVLIAARNEEAALPSSLDSLLAQDDPAEQVIVIDDGSTDGTLALLRERYPAVGVLSKAHSGKARSLNQALPLCTSDLVVTLDADTILEPGALAAVRRSFGLDAELTAACGVLTPVCQPGGLGPMFELYQTFEYLRSLLWRLAWSHEDTLVLVSGAFAIFRRPALLAVGGFDATSAVEDYELLFRLHRRSLEGGQPLRVRVLGEARATTDVPARPLLFLRQRRRWFAGFIETMFRNRDMVGSRRFGRLGRFHLVVKTVDTLLPVYGLSAFLALILLLLRGTGIPLAILLLLAAKFSFDFSCHVYCLFLYHRWQGRPVSVRFFARGALASLTEPYFFQFLRQLGAVLGWIAFVRGRIEWGPERPARSQEQARG